MFMKANQKSKKHGITNEKLGWSLLTKYTFLRNSKKIFENYHLPHCVVAHVIY